jgi:hypothetical protein
MSASDQIPSPFPACHDFAMFLLSAAYTKTQEVLLALESIRGPSNILTNSHTLGSQSFAKYPTTSRHWCFFTCCPGLCPPHARSSWKGYPRSMVSRGYISSIYIVLCCLLSFWMLLSSSITGYLESCFRSS